MRTTLNRQNMTIQEAQGTLAKYGKFRHVNNYIAIGYGETQGFGHKIEKVLVRDDEYLK